MARWINDRILVNGTLVAESPLHVGGVDRATDVDLSLAVNGQGHYYVPGSSLAGALRAGMQALKLEAGLVEALWGSASDRGHASSILVEDAIVTGGMAERRDGVGIDRAWGTAADRFKYDRAILPKGSQFPLCLTLEQHETLDAELAKTALIQLVQALQQGAIRFGAAKTRGLGWVKLVDVNLQAQCFANPAGLLVVLQGQGESLSLPESPPNLISTQLTIEIAWQPIEPLMVKAEVAGVTVDTLPLVSAIGDRLSLVLPGSSVKGALRSQAERIIRTLCDIAVFNGESRDRFEQQLQIPLVSELFGTAATKQPNGNLPKKRQLGRLFVEDCYANGDFSSQQWEQMLAATQPPELKTALEQANLNQTQAAFHVAIDRWTGGAADGALYSTLEPMQSWQSLQWMLDFAHLDRTEQRSLLMLTLLLLRDLAEGRIPLGFATNRGMGTIQVDQIQLNGQILTELIGEEAIAIPNGDFSQLTGDWIAELSQDWQTQIDTIKHTLRGEA